MLSSTRSVSAVVSLLSLCLPALAADPNEKGLSPFPPRVEQRGNLKISIGEIRTVMRGPMFPSIMRLSDGTVFITASAAEEGGKTTSVVSKDNGATWKKGESLLTEGRLPDGHQQGVTTKLELSSGRCVGLAFATSPIKDRPGYYSTTRWESDDLGKTIRGPLTDGEVYLPAERFDANAVQWFHGNMVELSGRELLAVMQGRESPRGPFRVFAVRSKDQGKTWRFETIVAALDMIDDPEGRTKKGWLLHGPCEPTVCVVGPGRLFCAMRLVNDDGVPLLAEPSDTYRDLSYTVSGDEIHPGTKYNADEYYALGPSSVPLVACFSEDGGKTWSKPKLMDQARGCSPQTAISDGVMALTYGGLAYPRWGNSIAFSTDGGKTWTSEINFGPFLTTGYTGIVSTGPGKFLCVFDAAPPQPWTRHTAHWIGVVDISVEKQ